MPIFQRFEQKAIKSSHLEAINSCCVQLSKVYICNFSHNWAPSRSAHLCNFCEVRDNVQKGSRAAKLEERWVHAYLLLSQKWLSFLSKMMQHEKEAVNFAKPKVCRTQFSRELWRKWQKISMVSANAWAFETQFLNLRMAWEQNKNFWSSNHTRRRPQCMTENESRCMASNVETIGKQSNEVQSLTFIQFPRLSDTWRSNRRFKSKHSPWDLCKM